MALVDHSVVRLLTKVYRGLGSPVAQRALELLEKGEWGELQQLPAVDPRSYTSASLFRLDYQAREFFRKVELPGDKQKRAEKALETFLAAERANALTNARLSRFIHNGPFDPEDLPVADFISRWRKNCSRVLGRLPLRLTPRFTPGATLSDTGLRITIPDKMSSQLTLYSGMLDIWNHSVCGIDTLDRGHQATVVRSNKYFTVPKDSQTFRSCCVEASGAIMLQRDVGIAIRSRYDRAYSTELIHAQTLHRKLAREGSVDGGLATIDLSSASDTICKNLVKLVLPDDWYSLLHALRAPSTQVGGKILLNEKFSSMGNGFTFELETLIFRTLLETLGCETAHVFGDDIIVETSKATAVLAALRFFGFTPNPRKTFCDGPFRESCGGDFFLGVDVSPARLMGLPDEPQHWVSIANRLRRIDPHSVWSSAAWHFCVSQIPTSWRLYGPEWLGDTVIFDPSARPAWIKTKTFTGQGYYFMRPLPRTFPLDRHFTPDVAFKCAAMGVGPDISVRGQVSGYKRDWLPAYGVGGEPLEIKLGI